MHALTRTHAENMVEQLDMDDAWETRGKIYDRERWESKCQSVGGKFKNKHDGLLFLPVLVRMQHVTEKKGQ